MIWNWFQNNELKRKLTYSTEVVVRKSSDMMDLPTMKRKKKLAKWHNLMRCIWEGLHKYLQKCQKSVYFFEFDKFD